jgi:hypothetical protein
LDNLAANLATDALEATIRFSNPLDIPRRGIDDQGLRTGKFLGIKRHG